MADREHDAVTLHERAAVRIDEAAALVGLSENAFREHLLPSCPKFYCGRSVRIPLEAFRRFLAELAQQEAEAEQALADRISPDAGL